MKPMAILLMLTISLASGLYDVSYMQLSYDLNGYIDGQLVIHVPANSSAQSVVQTTKNSVYRDDAGDYIIVSGNYSYKAVVKANSSPEIKHNPSYPLITEEEQEYTLPTYSVLSNSSNLKQTAEQAIGDAKTELEVVARIVEWVNENVKYDLSAQRATNSDQVLAAKKGVCVEHALITVAMLRSASIPAKYVEGFIYNGNGFTAHAWAEFYIPGAGWFTADATFSEIGSVSARRVKIAEGKDPIDLSDAIKIQEGSPSFTKNPAKIDIQSVDYQTGAYASTLSSQYKEAGPGSIIEVYLQVQNQKQSYQTPTITLAHSLEIQDAHKTKILTLKPYATETAKWEITLPSAGSKDYFISAIGSGVNKTITLKMSQDAPVYSKENMEITSISKYIRDGKIYVTITIKNTGNTEIRGIVTTMTSGLYGEQQQTTDLLPDQEKPVRFIYPEKNATSYYFNVRIAGKTTEFEQSIAVTSTPEPQITKSPITFSRNEIDKIFIGVFIIICLIVGAIFISPLLVKGKKPFLPIRKREVKLLKEHKEKRKIQKSMAFLKEKEEEHDVKELLGKK